MELTNSLLVVKPGMYILRYPGGGIAPLTVCRAPARAGYHGRLELMGTAHTQGTTLRDGRDCIAMLVSGAPVELLVTAYLPHAGAPVPALRLDQIGLDDDTPAAAAAPAQPAVPVPSSPSAAAGAPAVAAAPAVAPPSAVLASPAAPHAHAAAPLRINGRGISLIGHIERAGDVVAGDGELLGDPASTARLEGFQLMWPDRPDGVDIAYSVAVEGAGRMPTVGSGNFCGSRGQARRITEVTFSIIGAAAHAYALAGTAYFSGGFQMDVAAGVPLSGPSGLEHLTALTLRALPAGAPPNPWNDTTRTLLFKAQPAAGGHSISKAGPM